MGHYTGFLPLLTGFNGENGLISSVSVWGCSTEHSKEMADYLTRGTQVHHRGHSLSLTTSLSLRPVSQCLTTCPPQSAPHYSSPGVLALVVPAIPFIYHPLSQGGEELEEGMGLPVLSNSRRRHYLLLKIDYNPGE